MEPELSTHRFPALVYRDFRLIWTASFISNIGNQMQMVAINWQIYVLTHSAFALGIIGLIRFLPIVIFSLLGGSVADSYNRKKILFITQSLLAGFSLILAFLTVSDHITQSVIYLLTLCSTATAAFDRPAFSAVYPSIVKRNELAGAMSLSVIQRQIATIVGPALSGFLIAGAGVGSIYFLNALSFLAVIIALLGMQFTGEIYGENAHISFQAISEGIQFVKSKTIIWSTMLLDFFSVFFGSASTMLPIFAKDILSVGPIELGFLYAAEAVGASIASIIIAQKRHIRKEGKMLLIAVTCYALGTIVFGFSKIFLLSFFALAIVGAGDSISTIIRNTIRQLETPDYIRGRMLSINMIFFAGGPQLGEFEAGTVASLVSAPFSVISGGIGTLLVIAIVTATIPLLRNYDRPKDA